MNNGPLLFLGIFATLASSFWGLILLPQMQIGRQQAVVIEESGAYYPPLRAGEALQGAEVYRSMGCVECHSQQVRGLDGDLARAWGRRISVAQDYLHDDPVLLGQLRLGPDLANVGARQPDLNSHLLRLWDPRLVMPGSSMPRYRFLFEKRRLKPGEAPPRDALKSEGLDAGDAVVPRPDAVALAKYLMSLRADPELFEAPLLQARTNAGPRAVAGTNAMVADTNASPLATNAPGTNAPANAPVTNAPTNSSAPAK